MKKFSEFRKTQTWEDLRISLLLIPLIRIVFAFAVPYVGLFPYGGAMFLNPTEKLVFSFFNTLIVMFSYLSIPLIIRFVIRRRPLQRGHWICYLVSFLLAGLGKGILVTIWFSASQAGTVPILEAVAVYYVLVAGYKEASLYEFPAIDDECEEDDEYEGDDEETCV